MPSAMDCGNELALTALIEMTAAAAIIPAAWPCVELMVLNQSDPGGIYDKGMTWLQLAEELGAAADGYHSTAGSFGKDLWESADRDAFDRRIGQEQTQLQLTQMLAVVVGICLIIMSIMLFMLIIIMFICATILAVLAALIVMVMAGVITAPGAAMLEFEAEFIAGDAFLAIEGASNLTATVSHTCAGAITQAMGIDVAGQAMEGNTGIGKEALAALLSSTDDIFWGALSRTERDITAGFAGHGNPASILLGGADARSTSGTSVGTDYVRGKYDEWQDSQR